MKKTLNRICYFFLALTLLSVCLALTAKGGNPPAPQAQAPALTQQGIQLPDEDSTFLNAMVSVMGGFGGSGLLLVFLIRRLVNSYDASFAQMETRCCNHTRHQDDRNDKIINMIEAVQNTTQELKMEIIKMQAGAVDKDDIVDAFTKVAVLETDVDQVRGEVRSIMTHLLGKPRSALLKS
jgi:hypothetical protein